MYKVQFDSDPTTMIDAENFSISKQFSDSPENPQETSMTITFLCKDAAVENYLKEVGKPINKVEVFLTENNKLVYSSTYWTIKRNMYISFNAARNSMVAELFLLH